MGGAPPARAVGGPKQYPSCFTSGNGFRERLNPSYELQAAAQLKNPVQYPKPRPITEAKPHRTQRSIGCTAFLPQLQIAIPAKAAVMAFPSFRRPMLSST
jgi:hypothetical protein